MSAILDEQLNLHVPGITSEVTLRGTIDNYAKALPLMGIKDLCIEAKSPGVDRAIAIAEQFFYALEEEYRNKRGPKYDLKITIQNPVTKKVYRVLPDST